MIWARFFGDVADVPVVSPTSQWRWEKQRSVQLLRMSPMHRRHVPVDAGLSPSFTTIWKPGITSYVVLVTPIKSTTWRMYLSQMHAMMFRRAFRDMVLSSGHSRDSPITKEQRLINRNSDVPIHLTCFISRSVIQQKY